MIPLGSTAAEGLVVVDKPAGLTSHGVVARVRKIAGTRKVGHAGTLDPMATGVLILGVGRATRLLGHVSQTSKAYSATIRLGQSTVTDDAEGELLRCVDPSEVTVGAVAAAVADLTGPLSQVPSAVSAVKVDGKRAYARVRAGEDVVLTPREVVVDRFDVLQLRHAQAVAPDGRTVPVLDLDVEVECTTGTYVRALARDVGTVLGVGGHLTRLRRTRVGPWSEESAHSLDALAEDFVLVSLNDAAAAAFPRVDLDAELARRVVHGLPLEPLGIGHRPTAAFAPDGAFLALVQDDSDRARSLAVFLS